MLEASVEVRSAVLYGTLIVIAVFFPVFTLQGLSGAFFRPLALSYVFAILASLLVALTITPAMALLLLTGKGARATEPRLVTRLKRSYERLLAARSSIGPALPGVVLATLLVGTMAAVPLLGEELLPELPRVRLPDALGREAGRVGRGEHAASPSAPATS